MISVPALRKTLSPAAFLARPATANNQANAPTPSGDRFVQTGKPDPAEAAFKADAAFRRAAMNGGADAATHVAEAAAKFGAWGAAAFAYHEAGGRAETSAEALDVARSAARLRLPAEADAAFRRAAELATAKAEALTVGRAAVEQNLLGVAHYAFQRIGTGEALLPLPEQPPYGPLQSDAAAQKLLDKLPALAAAHDALGVDETVRLAADTALTSRVAALAGRAGGTFNSPGPAEYALSRALSKAQTSWDAWAIAREAVHQQLPGVADLAFRRAADLARYADQARELAADARECNILAAAYYATRAAGSLPARPEPIKPPHGK